MFLKSYGNRENSFQFQTPGADTVGMFILASGSRYGTKSGRSSYPTARIVPWAIPLSTRVFGEYAGAAQHIRQK